MAHFLGHPIYYHMHLEYLSGNHYWHHEQKIVANHM